MTAASPVDLEVAAVTAAVIVAIFLITIWAQRKLLTAGTAQPRSPIEGHAKNWPDVFDQRLGAFEGWAKTVDHDLKNIRAALPALPSKDAVHRLEVQVTQLAGKIETTDATVMATARAVDRIETHLINASGNK